MKLKANIVKSSRHSKIIGNFGESILCNWLSRTGFEVAIIDHTGIDIIAYKKETGKRLGITVKSRTRCKGKECESVNLLKNQDYIKVKEACEAFGCEPWIGIYVETENYGDIYLMSLSYYEDKYRKKDRILDDWKMTEKYKRQYASDEQIKHIHIDFKLNNWNWK
jgi:Holliday junction resolvase-like predicted endonuclease